MNRAYRLVWSAAKNVWVMAAEIVKGKGGRSASGAIPLSSLIMALEPRFMFDAAGVATADVVADKNHEAPAPVHVSDNPVPDGHDNHSDLINALSKTVIMPAEDAGAPATTGAEIAFVDARVPDIQTLIAGIRPGVKFFVLDPDKDGVTQVAEALRNAGKVSAIHIVSHGAPGDLFLGATELNSETLASRANDLSAWHSNLAAGADILIYGCDVAKGSVGQQFVQSLSKVTGADVAASGNSTGAAVMGGDWTLETTTGPIEAARLLTAEGAAAYQDRLSTISLSGNTGWTAIMYGAMKDPDGDSQAGAADTDIIGDSAHGSLYTAYDDNGTATTTDDFLAFRMRIDNATSTTYFGGVAIVGMDANLDGRIDLFMSVDGRNNTQAVRLLDPGTDANISPNTTSTSPLPTGWLPSNGIYPFSNTAIYNVSAVSANTDPNWGASTLGGTSDDLTGDGKTDVFISWKIPLAELATVLGRPSPTDRSGVVGPRGTTGIVGFTKDTTVQYVSFTQTQPGPINGDLNGVGASYDKNATFASLGAFTTPMSASNPVAEGPGITIAEPISGGLLNDAEDNSVSISGSSKFLATKPLTLTVTDGSATVTGSTTTAGDGSWTVSGLDLSGLNDGTLTVTATIDPDSNAGTDNNIIDTAAVLHDKTPPAIGIDQLAAAVSGTPVLTGTSNLPDGSLISLTIDPDNNSGTANSLVYQVMVSGGAWSLDTAAVTPTSGTMPGGGLTSFSRITATAADVAGNSATATAINRPTVDSLNTNDTTPLISGTWTNIPGDVLNVTVSGATYTLAPAGNTWSLDLGAATPSSGSLTALVAGSSYPVTATVTRGVSVSDTTTNELTITNTPVVAIDITGGATASGSDTTPVIDGTSSNPGGFVVVRLDPNNDGNLSDAVTYSVATAGGAWSLDTGTATPISGMKPAGGFVGAVGILATDSTGAVSDSQVLTITTPAVAIGSIISTAATDAFGQVDNAGAAANWLNMTEDNLVFIAGTATGASTVDIVITDPNGNFVEYTNVAVSGGNWSVTNKDLSTLDNGTLTVVATISGTSISATNTTVTHDKLAPQLFSTTASEIKKAAPTMSGGSELVSTALTVTVAAASPTGYSITTAANGDWTVTPTITGNPSSSLVTVNPTSTTTDTAGNIVQSLSWSQTIAANASSNTISIGTIAGDNIITSDEIASGVTISGTTTLTGTPTITITVTDGTTTLNPAAAIANGGSWTTTLTLAQIQSLANGPLTVTATAPDGTLTIKDITLPVLSLPSPVLTITDNVPGTASGDVTFTFTFTEAVTGFDSGDITVTNATKGAFSGSGTTYTLVVTPTGSSSGNIDVSVARNYLGTGIKGVNTGRTNTADIDTQSFDTTGAAAPPTVSISTANLATDTTPVITGTTSLSAGAPIIINIDTDNNGTTDLTYSATVQAGGNWSLDIGSATPTFGTLSVDGLSPSAKVTATATNAFGNSTSAIGLNTPTVSVQITNDNTPTVSGAWTQVAGDTLAVVVDGVTYSVANGNLNVTATGWSLTPTLALADNSYNVTATTTRAGGGSAVDGTAGELIVDTTAVVDITSYGGGPAGSTNDPTPVISGTTTGIPNGTVLTLSLDTDNNGSYELVYKTTVNGNAWSVDTAIAIPFSGTFPASGLNGAVPMQATATDPATNTGSDAQTLTVDVTPPVIALSINSKTSDTTPLITGTTDLPVGSTITVDIDPNNDGIWTDKQTYTTTVQTGGTWSVEATTAVSGTVGVRASGTDSNGNNATTAVKPLQIAANAPTITVGEPIAGNNIADAAEDDAITFSGTTANVAVGSTVTVAITDGSITITDTVHVTGTSLNGSWSLALLNLSSMANGPISVTAVVVDPVGDAYSDSANFTHDKSATVAIDSISEDTGVIADFITKDSTIVISGSADSGPVTSVVVKNSGGTPVFTFNNVAVVSGAWTTGPTGALAPGNYTIEATIGGTTVTRAMTIVDAVAPTLTASTPADDAVNVAVGNNLTLTFSKNIQAGSGFISLYKGDGSLIESFNVSTGSGDAGGTITFNGTTGITLNPQNDLIASTGYYVQIADTAVIDNVGNAFAGISNATTLNFTTAAAIGASPVINDEVVALNENSANTTVVYDVNAVGGTAADKDADGQALTYSITAGNASGAFDINATTGVITVNDVSKLDFETTPSFNLTVQASDGSNTDTASITINLNNLNDNNPAITSNGGGASAGINVAENSTAVTTVTATDADAGSTLTYSIAGGADQALFTINSSTGALAFASAPNFETPTDAGGNNVYDVTVQVSDGSNTDTQAIAVTVVDVLELGAPPVITSNGGGATAAISINEGATAVTTVAATDADGTTPTFSITGGTDQARFTIDATTGALAFAVAPDYETPTDSDTNNTYVVNVTATDGTNTDVQAITVTVLNLNDNTPVITSDGGGASAAISINEGTTAVTTVAATDADGATPTYSISGGADAARFTIDATTGALAFAVAPDYEAPADSDTNNTYVVNVTATDGTNTDIQAITVTVLNLNDNNPVISSNGVGATAAISIAENSTVVTTVTATDADAGSTLTYSIAGGADQAHFTINGTTGALAFASAPNFETPTDAGGNNVYDVTVQVSDGSNTDTQAIAVTVTNVNDNTPAITSNGGGATAAISINEGATAVTTVAATDADGTTPTYSISGGTDAARFTIDATTGALAFAVAPDYEAPADSDTNNTYVVNVTATDGTNTDVQAITVTVLNLNDNAPVINDATVAIDENSANGTAVYNVDAVGGTSVDRDADGDALTYSITAGNASGALTINAATGVITVADATKLDFETTPAFNLTVQASDGTNTDTAAITINLNNLNDNPVSAITDSNLAASSVNENAANGTVVGITAHASDADAGATITYSLSDDAGGRFEINAANGVITVASGTLLDYEAATSHNVTVLATSSDGSTNSGVFTINLNNLNDNPVSALSDSNAAANSVNENAANGTAVSITALASDADSGTTISYSLTDDAGGRFAINSSTGVITVANVTLLDYEAATSHNVTVLATSSDGSTNSGTFTINLNNLNDNPVSALSDTNTAANQAAENASNGTAVGITAHASDADSGATITYSLSDDAGGRFAIDANTGVITVAGGSKLDYESATSHNATVLATSSDGSTNSGVFTINLNNVNDNSPVLGDYSVTINDNSANGTPVQTVTATDAGDNITYGITAGNASGAFAINAATGAITVNDATKLNFETAPTFTLTVQASDGSHTDTGIVTVNLLDKTPPSEPVITKITENISPVEGTVANGGHTNDATPTLTGTAEAGSRVSIFDNGTLVTTVDADRNGSWSFTFDTLTSGSAHNYTVTAADAAGNVSSASAAYKVTIDPEPPAPPVAPVSPRTSPPPPPVIPVPPRTSPPPPPVIPVPPRTSPQTHPVPHPSQTSPTFGPTPDSGPAPVTIQPASPADPSSLDPFPALFASQSQPELSNSYLLVRENGGHSGASLYVRLESPPQEATINKHSTFQLPQGIFVSTRTDDQVTIKASLIDGGPLPAWLNFNPINGVFSGTPPAGTPEMVQIKLTANDSYGNETSSVFLLRINPPEDRGASLAPAEHHNLKASADHPGQQHDDAPEWASPIDPLLSPQPVIAGRPSLADQFARHGRRGMELERLRMVKTLQKGFTARRG